MNIGESYEGDLLNGTITGEGTKMQLDGSDVTGSFLNGKAHGQCVKMYACGDEYRGEYQHDKYVYLNYNTSANPVTLIVTHSFTAGDMEWGDIAGRRAIHTKDPGGSIRCRAAGTSSGARWWVERPVRALTRSADPLICSLMIQSPVICKRWNLFLVA